MKSAIKDKIFNYMFDTLCKYRHDDLIRAANAIQSGEKRSTRTIALKRWFKKMTGEAHELTEQQLADVKAVW